MQLCFMAIEETLINWHHQNREICAQQEIIELNTFEKIYALSTKPSMFLK